VFEGTCYVTPLLGAYLADSHWGRYKTILVFSTIYLCGCILLTATSGLPGLTPGEAEQTGSRVLHVGGLVWCSELRVWVLSAAAARVLPA